MTHLYREKNPATFEAARFAGNNTPEHVEKMDAIVAWLNDGGRPARHDGTSIYFQHPTVSSVIVVAEVGDYILKNAASEFSLWRAEEFEANFERIPEDGELDPLHGGALVVKCPDCDAALAVPAEGGFIQHHPDGSHTFNPQL